MCVHLLQLRYHAVRSSLSPGIPLQGSLQPSHLLILSKRAENPFGQKELAVSHLACHLSILHLRCVHTAVSNVLKSISVACDILVPEPCSLIYAGYVYRSVAAKR